MHKFFTPAHMFSDTHATITGEDVKHIYKVLRVKPGEKVVVNNLESEEFLGEVEEVNKQEVSIKILEKLDVNNESNLNITLFFRCIRHLLEHQQKLFYRENKI